VYTNDALVRMRTGKPALGAAPLLGAPVAAEYLASCGFDYVLVDNQHGIWDDLTTVQAVRGIFLCHSIPVVRVRSNDFGVIGRALDGGALGIIVPMVNTVEQARAAAYAMRYPPRGGRSLGPVGVGFMGADYKARANDEVFLAIQIESGEAVEHAEELLAVEGVDGCWVGPSDLALSMGLDLTTAEGRRVHEEAILSVIAACHKTNKFPGLAATPDNAEYWIKKGMLFINCCSDLGFLSTGGSELLARLRRTS